MTYLGFHGVLALPPLLLLGWRSLGRLARVHPRAGQFLVAMAATAGSRRP